MIIEAGKVAIVRFPGDTAGGKIAVAIVKAYRGELVMVAKSRGRGGFRKWAAARWVPAANVAREATARETQMGCPIDAVPHNDGCPCATCEAKAA